MSQRSRPSNDFIAGSISGGISIAVGQPFDTIKVRVQCGDGHISLGEGKNGKASSWSVIRTVFQEEGALSLFRGMSAPLVTSTAQNAILFTTYASVLRMLGTTSEKGSIAQITLAGGMAGAVQSLVTCPADLIKCRMQVHGTHGTAKGVVAVGRAAHLGATEYRGVTDCIAQAVGGGRGLRGLYTGFGATLVRDVPSFALYFSVYETLKLKILETFCPEYQHFVATSTTTSTFNTTRADDTPWYIPSLSYWHASMFAGGLSGLVGWALFYPLDVAKSTIQAELPSDRRAGEAAAMQQMQQQPRLNFHLQAQQHHAAQSQLQMQLQTGQLQLHRAIGRSAARVATVASSAAAAATTVLPAAATSASPAPLAASFFTSSSGRGGGGEAARRDVIAILRKHMEERGMRNLYRGLAPCLWRAFLVNATVFPMYELVLEFLDRTMHEHHPPTAEPRHAL